MPEKLFIGFVTVGGYPYSPVVVQGSLSRANIHSPYILDDLDSVKDCVRNDLLELHDLGFDTARAHVFEMNLLEEVDIHYANSFSDGSREVSYMVYEDSKLNVQKI